MAEDIVARCRKYLSDDQKHHDIWANKVDSWYRAYRGEYDDERMRANYRSDFKPRILFQIIETLASGLSDTHPRWRVKPRPKAASDMDIQALQEGAKQLEYLLAYQRDVDGMVEKQRRHRLQGLIAGLTVWKTYWKYSETTRTSTQASMDEYGGYFEQDVSETVPYDDDPCVDLVDVRDFIWPESATSIESAPRLHHRVWMTYEQLLEKQKAGYYKNVAQLKETRDQSGDGSASQREEDLFAVDRTKGRIKVVEHWIDYGKRVVTIANDNVLLRDVPNPYKHGGYPFIAASPYPELFRLAGISVVELVEDLQRMLWDLARRRHDNLEYLNNAIVLVPDSVLSTDYVFAPGEQWLIEAQDNAPRLLDMPEFPAAVSLQAEQILKADIQAIPGASPALVGQADQTQQTATEISLLANLAQRRLSQQKQQFTIADIRVAEQWIQLNGQFLEEPKWIAVVGPDGQEGWTIIDPSKFKDGDYSIEIEQMDESLIRQERLAETQSRLQVLASVAGPMAAMQQPLNLKAAVEDVLDAAGIENKERYFSANPQPMAPQGQPGQNGQGGLPPATPEGQGLTNIGQAAGQLAPSNPVSMSPLAATQRLLSQGGGPANA